MFWAKQVTTTTENREKTLFGRRICSDSRAFDRAWRSESVSEPTFTSTTISAEHDPKQQYDLHRSAPVLRVTHHGFAQFFPRMFVVADEN